MQCRQCKAENEQDRHFCAQCGGALPVTCPGCGFTNEPSAKFCGGCGAALKPSIIRDGRSTTQQAPSRAERRQLTVLFCDLVGSTELSGRLDPEDLGQVMRAYQERCNAVVKRWEGHVAKFMGDGVLVCFGFPWAHEDDAERAVRAGLDLVQSVRELTADDGTPLAARVGIATGLVMVGELIGEGPAREEAVVGETPNLAARLQALAEPNTVVISRRTRKLIGGLFDVDDLGVHHLKGIAKPVRSWRVLGESSAESRFEALHGSQLLPLLGREHEVGLLLDRWARAKDGEGQVVLLSGEAGIGKSRMVRALRERLEEDSCTPLYHYCSPYHVNSAFYPVIALLERAAGFERDDPSQRKLEKLEALLALSAKDIEQAAGLIAPLLALPTEGRYPPLDMTPQRQKQRTIEVLADQLEGLAASQTVLAVYEDVHWMDPTTLELIGLVIERALQHRVLILITYRPEFTPPWTSHAHLTQLSLTRLARRSVVAMVNAVTSGKPLPDVILDQIVARTDGVPLFVEELTKTVLESGLLKSTGERFELTGPLPSLAIPATLHDSLVARLDRMAPVKEVAQVGAVIGREFSQKLLLAVADRSGEQLEVALDQLVGSGLVFRSGSARDVTYRFKHALVQDAAYQSLLKNRRAQLHARIARVLEERFPETAEISPEVLAHHFTEAGLLDEAVGYWWIAGQRASERSAHLEAIAHLSAGLTVLGELPDTSDRAKKEIDFQLALGPALIQTKGYAAAEVEAPYIRAQALCRQIDDPTQLFTATFGLWILNVSRMQLITARRFLDELRTVAQGQSDPGLLLQAHHAAWSTFFYLPELPACFEHTELSPKLYDIDKHASHKYLYAGHDPGVCGRNYGAMTSVLLGRPDQAVKRARDAVALARKLKHPFSLVLALVSLALVHQFRRDAAAARKWAKAVVALCSEQGIAPHYRATGQVIRGWAKSVEEGPADGIEEIQKGLDGLAATGVGLRRSYCLALLAECCQRIGDIERGLSALTEAMSFMKTTGEKWWEAELHRLKGELLIGEGSSDWQEGEACLIRALEVARAQSGKLLELRAATGLARLWCQQDKRDKASELLAPIYGWFDEGFDIQDLREAKALLLDLNQTA